MTDIAANPSVSSQTLTEQVSRSEGSPGGGSPTGGVFSQSSRTSSKTKTGAFARLLDGLTARRGAATKTAGAAGAALEDGAAGAVVGADAGAAETGGAAGRRTGKTAKAGLPGDAAGKAGAGKAAAKAAAGKTGAETAGAGGEDAAGVGLGLEKNSSIKEALFPAAAEAGGAEAAGEAALSPAAAGERGAAGRLEAALRDAGALPGDPAASGLAGAADEAALAGGPGDAAAADDAGEAGRGAKAGKGRGGRNAAGSDAAAVTAAAAGDKPAGDAGLAAALGSTGAKTAGEGEGTGEKSRGRTRGRDRLAVEVRDLRSGGGQAGQTPGQTAALSSGGRTEVELAVDLASGSRLEGDTTPDTTPGDGSFEDALARELRDNLGSGIVQQASILLRDGGEGAIRLSLKPETLGNVKIRLELAENKITGHIVVESSEAFRAFERELPVLEKEFQESGFGETSLEMSFAWDGGGYGDGFDRGAGDGDFPRSPRGVTPVLAASRYDADPGVTAGVERALTLTEDGRIAVNMLV